MLLYPITYSTLYNADVWKFKFYTCTSLCIYRIIFYTTLMVPQYKQEQWQWCMTTENNRWLRSATRGSPWICSLAMWAININTNLYSWSKQNLKQKHKSYICNTKLMLFINCFSLFYERWERNKSNIDHFFYFVSKIIKPSLKKYACFPHPTLHVSNGSVDGEIFSPKICTITQFLQVEAFPAYIFPCLIQESFSDWFWEHILIVPWNW